MAEISDYHRWIASRLVDAAWYAATYPDVAEADAPDHFRHTGAAEGRNPNTLFHTAWYLAHAPGAAESGLNPLEHYVGIGAAAGLDPGPLFHTRWYLLRNPDVAAAGLNPLDHYLLWGPAQRRDPSPLFDSQWYFAEYPEARVEGMDAHTHFMAEGARLGFSPNPRFDTVWYLASNPDVAASGENPLLHYILTGAPQGRDPSPGFNTRAYLATHPDVVATGENPLLHHLADARAPAGPPPGALVNHISPAAIEAAAALLASQPRLGAQLPTLDTIALATPPAWFAAWRRLYLSLATPPSHLVLVGHIDSTPSLASHATRQTGLLVLETDSARIAIGDLLPPGTDWRSLAEFGPALTLADRADLLATLIATLRPESTQILASQAGHAMMARHGAALSSLSRLQTAARAETAA